MTEYQFTVEGRPHPKQRPRNRKGRWYTPKTTRDAEEAIAYAYDGPKIEGPVYVDIDFYPDRTVIWVCSIDGLSKTDSSPLRGDIDNYVKTVLDGLNGVAYEDDKQVCLVRAEKII